MLPEIVGVRELETVRVVVTDRVRGVPDGVGLTVGDAVGV